MESKAKLFGHPIHQMLVDRLGVGVDDGAHLDAPSSLSGPVPASGGTTRTRA